MDSNSTETARNRVLGELVPRLVWDQDIDAGSSPVYPTKYRGVNKVMKKSSVHLHKTDKYEMKIINLDILMDTFKKIVEDLF